MVKKYTRRRNRLHGKKTNNPTLRRRKQHSVDIFGFLKHTGGYKHMKTPGEKLISYPKTKTKTKSKTKSRNTKSRKLFKLF